VKSWENLQEFYRTRRFVTLSNWCVFYVSTRRSRHISTVLRKNLAGAKILKIEFSANLDWLGFRVSTCALSSPQKTQSNTCWLNEDLFASHVRWLRWAVCVTVQHNKAVVVFYGTPYISTRVSVIGQRCYCVNCMTLCCVILSVCLALCVSVCLNVSLSVCLSVYLSVCLHACLSVRLSVYMFVCLSVCLSPCLSVCPSVCVYVCLSVSLRHVHESVCYGGRRTYFVWAYFIYVALTDIFTSTMNPLLVHMFCGYARRIVACLRCYMVHPKIWLNGS